MSKAPAWLDRKTKLKIALGLIADNLFEPVYQSVERVIGTAKTDELLAWGMAEKEKQEQVEANPPPIAEDEPENIPPAIVDELDISNVIEASSGNIINEQSIPITHRLQSAKVQGGNVRIVNDLPASYWSNRTEATKFARGYCYWQADGKVFGGHFDWQRYGQEVKTLKNVYGEYFRIHPPAGARLFFSFVANDKSGRTQVVGS